MRSDDRCPRCGTETETREWVTDGDEHGVEACPHCGKHHSWVRYRARGPLELAMSSTGSAA